MENPKKLEMKDVWKKVVAKAWADPEWKARLLADPAEVLREEGVNVPDGLKIRVMEELPGVRTFILPREPEGAWDAEKLERKKAAHGGPRSCICMYGGESCA